MEHLIEQLEELCRLHGISFPDNNLFTIDYLDFGKDKDEVSKILDQLFEAYYEKCDL